jgi:hypothetical protein
MEPIIGGENALASKSDSPRWRLVLASVVLFKTAYLAGVYFCLFFWPDMDAVEFHHVMRNWPRDGGPVFGSHFATWDAAHYLFLSEVGYAPGVASDAFYPLWPLLIRWLAPLFRGSHLLSGLILANVLSTGAFVLFHRIAARRFGEEIANWSLVFLLIYPGSVFYQFIYSESLFLLLLMALWWALQEARYVWVWFAAFLLPLAKAVGVFCAMPIIWHILAAHSVWPLSTPASGSPVDAKRSFKRPGWLSLSHGSILAAPLAGWAAYLLLMRTWTGDAFWGFKAQKFWGVHSVWNLVNPSKFAVSFLSPSVFHDFRGSLLDRVLFIVLLYTLPVVWKIGKDMLPWIYFLGILPAMSGEFTSFTRFSSTAFPMFVALAAYFTRENRARARVLFVSVLAILHGFLLWRFVNFRWAG